MNATDDDVAAAAVADGFTNVVEVLLGETSKVGIFHVCPPCAHTFLYWRAYSLHRKIASRNDISK